MNITKQYKPLTDQEKKQKIEEAESKLVYYILEAIKNKKGVINQ